MCLCQPVAGTCRDHEKQRFASKKRSKMRTKESATVRKYIGKGIGELCAMKMCEVNRRNP
jgi:hypothetical protein